MSFSIPHLPLFCNASCFAILQNFANLTGNLPGKSLKFLQLHLYKTKKSAILKKAPFAAGPRGRTLIPAPSAGPVPMGV
jgi:hypothetical protein